MRFGLAMSLHLEEGRMVNRWDFPGKVKSKPSSKHGGGLGKKETDTDILVLHRQALLGAPAFCTKPLPTLQAPLKMHMAGPHPRTGFLTSALVTFLAIFGTINFFVGRGCSVQSGIFSHSSNYFLPATRPIYRSGDNKHCLWTLPNVL